MNERRDPADPKFQNPVVERFVRRGREVRFAARWCALKGLRGVVGDPLPDGLSGDAVRSINANPQAFALTVTKYRLARLDAINAALGKE